MTPRLPLPSGVVHVDGDEFSRWTLPEDGSVCALGVFDGLHRGHRRVLSAALERARESGRPALAFTFVNHPQNVIDPSRRPMLLSTPRRRIHLLAGMGFDYVVSPSFTRDFADLSARAFIE